MAKRICLLRGINVGGKNIIKMADLKACFEKMGFESVQTYIQSGNVVFESSKAPGLLTSLIEKTLLKKFKYKEPVLVLTEKKLESIIQSAPKGFGTNLENYRCDVIYIVKDITAKAFSKVISCKEGVDNVHVGKDAIYFSRLKSQASKSHLSKIVSKPEYKLVTVRNWNTTVKLKNLVDK